MIIAQLTITPLGEGTELHEYVKGAIEIIKKSGLRFEPNAMATVIEANSLEEIFDLVKEVHLYIIKKGARRVVTELKIDDRRDKEASIDSKINAIK